VYDRFSSASSTAALDASTIALATSCAAFGLLKILLAHDSVFERLFQTRQIRRSDLHLGLRDRELRLRGPQFRAVRAVVHFGQKVAFLHVRAVLHGDSSEVAAHARADLDRPRFGATGERLPLLQVDLRRFVGARRSEHQAPQPVREVRIA